MGTVTNKHNLPKSLYNAIVNDTYTGPKADSKVISVTTLINPPRIHFLKCKYWGELTEDISEAIWKLIGSATHAMIERAESKTDLTEQRIEKEINGLKISGAFDLYCSEEQSIIDYKITSAYTIVYNPNGKPEHIKQLNIYKYLLESCGFPVKELKIVAILRDWSEKNYQPGGNYPEIPVAVINIPVWGKEEIEKYLAERVELFKKCSTMAETDYPHCTDEEMWAKSATWAIMKEGRKSAVKVCATEQEAKDNMPNDGKHKVEHRPGDRLRCAKYCQVAHFCNQHQQYLKEKGGK